MNIVILSVVHFSKFGCFFVTVVAMAKIAALVEEVRRLREEVKAGQEETSRKLARSGRKDSYSFKRKANKIQHRFNEDVEEKLDEAEVAVAKAEPTAEGHTKEALGKIQEASAEDVFSAGDWPLLRDLQKPELQQLAAGLPDVVLSGRAESTTKKYFGAFQRWKVWAESMGIVPSFPVKGMHLALYMQHLSMAKHSRSAVEEVVHALAWVHKMAGIEGVAISPVRAGGFETNTKQT